MASPDGPGAKGAAGPGWPRTVRDTLGREVPLPAPPRRIVSLVPSTTESLAALGCAERVVGRTRYCVHPRPWVELLPAVGGTKAFDLKALAALEPDLVLMNEEENRHEDLERVAALAPVAVSRVHTLDEALADLEVLGRLVGEESRAADLVGRIATERGRLTAGARPFRYAYLVWRRPYMSVNDDTFVASLLGEAGGQNVFGGRAERYPEVGADELAAAGAEVILLPSEPYAFTAEHAREVGPRARRVDGELLCWHGARLAAGIPYLARCLRGDHEAFWPSEAPDEPL